MQAKFLLESALRYEQTDSHPRSSRPGPASCGRSATLLDKVEEALKRARLPPLDWYHVLHEIDRAPKGMMRQTGVQDRTQLAQYNVCRLVDRLEREGLVERRQCPLDARNNVLLITAKGRALRRADVAGLCHGHRGAFRRTPEPS